MQRTLTNDAPVAEAIRLLRRGGVVALPTETVYGLAGEVSVAAAVARIYTIKGRPSNHPLIVHVSGVAAALRYAAGNVRELRLLAARFWPGPLTIIVPKTNLVPFTVTGGQATVALRHVDHPLTQAVLNGLDGGVAAPSANRFGCVSPTTAQHVRDDLGTEVDFVLDGGPARLGVESTIVDVTGATPVILRSGAISATELSEALHTPVRSDVDGPARAPGMLASHYAPRTALALIDPLEIQAEIARRTTRGERVGVLDLPVDPISAAAALYASLRALDGHGYDVILATLPADVAANAAVRDRLTRAAAKG